MAVTLAERLLLLLKPLGRILRILGELHDDEADQSLGF